MKSGTTSLANWLGAHPDAFIAPGKEIHFFDIDQYWALGMPWYARISTSVAEQTAVGEGTPRYMFFERSVERMAQTLPDAKLIVCLREPTSRAFSHYLHAYHRAGVERRSFAAAIERELALPEGHEHDGIDGSYVHRGYYARQLERLATRYPRERIHVALFDDMKADPARVYREVCEFLGIAADAGTPNLGSRDNAAATYRPLALWRLMRRHKVLDRLPGRVAWRLERAMKQTLDRYPVIDPAVRDRLHAHFEPHNAALAAWLGRDLPEWNS